MGLFPNLSHLDLSGVDLHLSVHSASLHRLLSNPSCSVRSLRLCETHMTDGLFSSLCEVIASVPLTALDLAGNRLSYQSLALLARLLPRVPSLRYLPLL